MDHEPEWRDPLPDAVSTTFWGSLDAEDRRAVHSIGKVRCCPRGTVVCREGLVSARVLLIYCGNLAVFRDDSVGHRTVLARRGPGDIVGELSAVDHQPASATVSTIDQSTLLVIGADRFAALCKTRSRITWLILENVIARLRDSDAHRTRYWADVPRRTIMCLLELAEAGGQVQRPGQTAVLRLTQQDLADMVSSSLVSVTRALTELRRLEVVTTGRGRIVVHVDRLRSLLSTRAW